MNITSLRATRIGSHAHRYVSEKPRAGIVILVFRHGFNVLFNGDSDPGFVSIQTEGVPLHPWSIELTGTTRTPEVGAPCFAEATLIRFDNGLCIDIVSAEVCELRIMPWTQEESAHVQERIPIIEQLRAKELAARVPDPFQPQIDAILEGWRHSGSTDDLRGLIGLGTGSTPSGDDLIVGIVAGFAALGTTTLTGALRTTAIWQRTHPVSAQMLAAALDGAFSQSLRDLANQLGQAASTTAQLRQCVETLANQGATSGTAMLVGFTAACVC
jgi:uncharacterized protein DUF2877